MGFRQIVLLIAGGGVNLAQSKPDVIAERRAANARAAEIRASQIGTIERRVVKNLPVQISPGKLIAVQSDVAQIVILIIGRRIQLRQRQTADPRVRVDVEPRMRDIGASEICTDQIGALKRGPALACWKLAFTSVALPKPTPVKFWPESHVVQSLPSS